MRTEEEYSEIAEKIIECLPEDFAHFEELLVLEMVKSTLSTTHLLEMARGLK